MKFYGKPGLIWMLLLCFMVCFFCSCSVEKRTTVKNYPVDTPFVFNNKLEIEGRLVKDEKKRLSAELANYWDDSLKARRVQQFGLFYKLRNPPVFDTTNITRTRKFMDAYLNSQGYFDATLNDTFYVDTFKSQLRTTINITVATGKPTIIDSLGYSLSDTVLQRITNRPINIRNSLIKPGKTPFTKQVISNEIDRLVSLYRKRGFYLFSRDNLIAEADTTNLALLQLALDPFEQALLLTKASEERKENPTAIVIFKNRDSTDSLMDINYAAYKQYYIGNINYYPEIRFNQVPDSLMQAKNNVEYRKNEFTVYGNRNLFKFRPLREHTFIHRGALYNEENFYKTINLLSSIGAWQQVDSRSEIRGDTIDFSFFLTPAVKQNFTIDLEASRNTGDFLSAGNLFGLALNTTYRNRNVWHRAIQSGTSLRNGVELSFDKNNSLLQTVQSSLSHTYSFPKLITPFQLKGRARLDDYKTQLSLNGSYSERRNFFRFRSFVTNWGYEWKKRNKIHSLKIPNVELYSLDKLPGLVEAIKTNPFLKTAFNTGSVVSMIYALNFTFPDKNHPNRNNYVRFGAEEAGALLGRIKSLQDNIYQYIRLEGEYRRLINFRKTAVAMRAFAGFGYNYSDNPEIGNTLPFFKQFVAGGPNSMRAWGLRQLGLGSSLLSDTAGTKNNAFRDRYGDMQLETNIEYRYNIAEIGALKLGGAVFSDIGNIWNVKKDPNNDYSQYSLKRLGKDIAIGVGTGVRLDFNYFLIRVDFGVKLKDPARRANNGWLDVSDFTWKNYEYQRHDANGNVTSPDRPNYAIQLGIGLPF